MSKGKSKKSVGGDIDPINSLFLDLKKEISVLDPVSFIEDNLLVGGSRFNFSKGSGWKYMADIYRTVAAQAESKTAKPTVILKGRQVGATVMAAALSIYFAASGLYGSTANKPPMRIMHLFPTLRMTQAYAKDRIEPMLRDSVDDYISTRSIRNDKRYANNVHDDTITEKSFLGFNKIRVDSIGRNADRIRGTSQDVLFMDEIQDMNKTAVENALPILTASPYGTPTQGVQLYFGTPKRSGSFFWELWKESDKRFFELKCESCNHYFQLYNLENDDWMDIWVSGQIVKCPKCAFHQSKCEAVDRGRWKPTVEGRTIYTGFHFNMMLSPLFTKEDVLRKHPSMSTTSESTWKNEVLGDFYSGAGQPLTIEDIENFALDPNRGIAKGIPMTSDKIVCMGVDWGDKDAGGGIESGGTNRGQSYTAIAIISIDKEGVITIENAFRLKKNDFTYKVDVIKRLFEAFKVNNAAVDFAFGTDITRYFQNDLEFGNRFLGCWNTGNSNKLFSYDANNFKVSLNKNMMIDELFGMIRQSKLRFPSAGYAYETLRWLREHCASMEVEIKMKDGNPVKTYQKGAIQNDGLMALMYAVTAYKYIVTCGFKTNDVSKQKESERPMPILGYLPGMSGRG